MKAVVNLGINKNGNNIDRDILDLGNILIVGYAGNGKSTLFQHISKNISEPTDIIVIGEHNEGEDWDYSGLDEAFELLTFRKENLTLENINSIEEYNSKYPNDKLPHILVSIPNFKQVLTHLEKERYKEQSEKLTKLLSGGRAFGFVVVIKTTHFSQEYVPTEYSQHLNTIISFKTVSTRPFLTPEVENLDDYEYVIKVGTDEPIVCQKLNLIIPQ